MFKTIMLVSPARKQLAPCLKRVRCHESIYFSTSYNMSFMNMNFFNRNPKKGKKRMTGKFFKKASKAFGQGFLKGPDFFAVEQSLALGEADRLHLKAQECRKLKDYPQALLYYKTVFAVLEDYIDEDESLLAFYHQKVGDIHLEKDDVLAAVESFKLGLDVLIEAFGEEDLNVAKQYLLIGKYQMKERLYVEAVQNLHEALDIYLDNFSDHKKAVTSCYAKLAESYLHIGKYEEALENFENLIASNKQEGESPFLSQSYENFAIALAYTKHKYDEALLYLQKCLSKEMLLNGGSSLSSGNCYLKIGQINTMQGRHKEAMESYKKALEITKLIGGSHHRQTGSCYNAIGAVFLGQGKYSEAMEYFKMALNCFEEKDLEIYACYKNIAMTCFGQNRFETAVTNFEQSIEERSKILDFFTEVDAECGVMHGFLASLYIRNKNYSSAVEHYEQFFEIFFKLVCKQSWRSLDNSSSSKSESE